MILSMPDVHVMFYTERKALVQLPGHLLLYTEITCEGSAVTAAGVTVSFRVEVSRGLVRPFRMVVLSQRSGWLV